MTFWLKFIPVRGRKLFARLLSGDLVSGLKFIPVRGRKPIKYDCVNLHQVEIYPREGTKTSISMPNYQYSSLKFIPVRGRKLPFWSTNLILIVVEIYPREGTETACLHTCGYSLVLKFIPVRGWKHGDIEVSIVSAEVVEIYPRKGTETE